MESTVLNSFLKNRSVSVSRRIETGKPLVTELLPENLPDDDLRLGTRKGSGADDYLGRLAKYIPIEIVGLYVATSGTVPPATNGNPRCGALWLVFVINFLLVPLYFWFATTRGGNKPLWSQVVLASIAFPVWVFAIGGPFKCLSWYESWIASITLAFVTVVMGFYKPPVGS
jgi:hypothetical protein